MAGIAGQEQSRFGPSLALLGCDRMASGRFHLRRVAFHHASVATACADVMGDFSGSVAGCRHVSPFSATPRWESIQRDSAARIFLCHLRFVPFSNRYRNHDLPALAARFPWFPRIMGGHQAARSLHFIGLVIFIGFIVVHLILVIAHGIESEIAKIVLGDEFHSHGIATIIGLLAIAAVIAFHFWGTWYSLSAPSQAKRLLEIGVDSLRRLLFHHWASRQDYSHASAYARINGRPPRNETYRKLAASGFADWRLEVTGLVKRNLSLSLNDLHQMPPQTQTTLHCCIQGWSYLAQWTGVPVSTIMDACEPLPNARFLVFHTLDEKWENPGHGYYYEVIDLELAIQPQTILAYEMNRQPLPIVHGAPLRLRVENQLGYKMAKWVTRIEFVNSFKHFGKGQGGWRDDLLHYYPSDAGI